MGLFDDPLPYAGVDPRRMAPTAPVIPQAAAPGPVQQPSKPSFWQRLGAGAMNTIAPTPPGAQSLFSDDELKAAHRQALIDAGLNIWAASSPQHFGDPTPGLGTALAAGVGAGRQSMANSAAQQQAQQQLALQMRIRTLIPQLIKPGMSPAEQESAWQQVMALAMAGGDTAALGPLSQVLQAIKPAGNEKGPTWHPAGGEQWLIDPNTGQILRREKMTPSAKSPAEVDAGRRFQSDQANKILDDFRADTKKFGDVMEGWHFLQGALKTNSLATPFAVTDAYARISNPGAIVRPTTQEMIDKTGSLGQRMQKWWEHNANGTLPEDIQRDFVKTMYNAVKEQQQEFKDTRRRALLRAKQAGVEIEPLLKDYELADPYATPAPAAPATGATTLPSSKAWQYLPK